MGEGGRIVPCRGCSRSEDTDIQEEGAEARPDRVPVIHSELP